MATLKQLAALKKGREARAKKLATSTKKKAPAKKKAPVKKAPAKRAYKTNPIKSPVYVVEVKTRGNKIGFLTSSGLLDTEKSAAMVCSLANAEKKATAFFNRHKAHLLHVKVTEIKK